MQVAQNFKKGPITEPAVEIPFRDCSDSKSCVCKCEDLTTKKVLHVFQMSLKMNHFSSVSILQLHVLTKGALKAQLYTQGCTAFISIKKLT